VENEEAEPEEESQFPRRAIRPAGSIFSPALTRRELTLLANGSKSPSQKGWLPLGGRDLSFQI